MAGPALKQFSESLELAKALVDLERAKYPNGFFRIAEQPVVQGLRGGAAVLMVAAFEFFIRRLFEDGIACLSTPPVTVDFHRLPDQLRIKAVFHGMQRALDGPRFGEKKKKIDRIEAVIAAAKYLIVEHIDPSTFSETNSNPGGETIKEKFREIGRSDVFGAIKPAFEQKWGSSVADTFINDKLNEIVRQRNVVAHTADTLNISRKNQNESLKFLRILAELLEKDFETHMQTICTAALKVT